VAQAILTSISYLPLLNALIDLWQTRAEKGDEREGTDAFEHKQRKLAWVKYVGWFVTIQSL
jgi:bacteriorhodopsin